MHRNVHIHLPNCKTLPGSEFRRDVVVADESSLQCPFLFFAPVPSLGSVVFWTGTGMSAELAQAEATAEELGPDFQRLSLELLHVAHDILRIRIQPAGEEVSPRWQVPSHLLSGSVWRNGVPSPQSFSMRQTIAV